MLTILSYISLSSLLYIFFEGSRSFLKALSTPKNFKNNVNLCLNKNFSGIYNIALLYVTFSFLIGIFGFKTTKYFFYVYTFFVFLFLIYQVFSPNSRIRQVLKKTFFAYLIFLSVLFLSGAFWYANSHLIKEIQFASYGSLHSNRYETIINFLLNEGAFVNLKQNLGTAFMAAIISNKIISITLCLNFLLIYSGFLLVQFLYSFLKENGRGQNKLFIILFTLAAPSSFGFAYIILVDSVSPIIFNGYADVILGLLCLILLFHLESKSLGFIYQFIPFIFLTLVQPHLIIIYLLVAFIFNKKIFYINLLGLAFIVSTISGGMLSLREQVKIEESPNVAIAYPELKPRMQLGLQQVYLENSEWYALRGIRKDYTELIKKDINLKVSIFNIIFPILGFLLIFLKKRPASILSRHFSINQILWVNAVFLFIPLFLSLGGYKWELTRFLVPFIFFGNLSFAIWADEKIKNNIYKYVFFLFLFLPVSKYIVNTEFNIDLIQSYLTNILT
jgi:hypothetical protein